MAKLLTDETALQLTEALLQNDKNIKENLEDKVIVLENNSHVHHNQDVLDKISVEKINIWDNKSEFDGSYNSLTDVPTNLATEEYVIEVLKDVDVDLSNYYTKDNTYSKTEVDMAISNAQLSGGDVDLTNYVTTENLDAALNNKADIGHKHNLSEITDYSIPDLSDYAKIKTVETLLDDKADVTHAHDQYLTEHQSLDNYALKTDIPEVYDDTALTETIEQIEYNLENKADKSSLNDLVTTEAMNVAIANAQLSGSDVDLTAYYTKTETDSVIDTKLSALDLGGNNIIESVSVDGVALIPDENGNVNIEMPIIHSVSVLDFNCAADGTTDNTINLQTAIEYTENNGGTLYFPPGTYVFSDRLFIKKPIKIIGSSSENTKLLFIGGTNEVTTSKFDPTWWEESDSAICIQSNNVSFESISIDGNVNNINSKFNGICMHYTHLKNGDSDRDCYYSAEKVCLRNVIINGFRNNLFIYAGWQRLIENCDFKNAQECGIKYYPLELDTVGNWSCSGDIIRGCSFIGNNIGFFGNGCYQLSMENGVFEYNNVAIKAVYNQDIQFVNCWNEANINPLYIEGNARFIGGYNITKDTIDHRNGYVTIQHSDDVMVIKGAEIVFHQKNGIIITGVEIGLELENLLRNTGFYINEQGAQKAPSFDSWTVYPGWAFNVNTEYMYEDNYSVKFSISERADNPEFGIDQRLILLEGDYNISCKLMSHDRSTIDAGFMIGVIYYNSDDVVIGRDNYIYHLVGNDVWETVEHTFTIPSGISYVKVKFGVKNNGDGYIAIPSVSNVDIAGKNNVYLKMLNEDTEHFYIYNINGDELGKIKIYTNEESNNNGKSAYEIACDNGFVGTEQEWLESLKADESTVEAIVDKAIEGLVSEETLNTTLAYYAKSADIPIVDSVMSDVSTNAVQNAVVKKYIDDKEIIQNIYNGNEEVILWDGSEIVDCSTDGSLTLTGQTLTLSDNWHNYDSIKIVYRARRSDTGNGDRVHIFDWIPSFYQKGTIALSVIDFMTFTVFMKFPSSNTMSLFTRYVANKSNTSFDQVEILQVLGYKTSLIKD